jgi:hypothetical protein
MNRCFYQYLYSCSTLQNSLTIGIDSTLTKHPRRYTIIHRLGQVPFASPSRTARASMLVCNGSSRHCLARAHKSLRLRQMTSDGLETFYIKCRSEKTLFLWFSFGGTNETWATFSAQTNHLDSVTGPYN